MGSQAPPPGETGNPGGSASEAVKDVELLRVVVARDGRQVNAQWEIHPQLKHDMKPEEWKEVTDLMKQVTGLVGGRFSKLLAEVEPDQPGNA